MKVEGDKSTASLRRCMRVYAPLRCIVKVENGCAGPWNADVGIRMLPTKTIHAMLPKNRDIILQFFLRLCRATDRFTHREGMLGVHGVPKNTPTYTKKWLTAKTMVWRSDLMEGAHTSSIQNPTRNVCLPCRYSTQKSPR
jgi:hypothetical protein